MLNNGSDDEVCMYEEWEQRLGEYVEVQRANCPSDVNGVKTPHVVYEDKDSSQSSGRQTIDRELPVARGEILGRSRSRSGWLT